MIWLTRGLPPTLKVGDTSSIIQRPLLALSDLSFMAIRTKKAPISHRQAIQNRSEH